MADEDGFITVKDGEGDVQRSRIGWVVPTPRNKNFLLEKTAMWNPPTIKGLPRNGLPEPVHRTEGPSPRQDGKNASEQGQESDLDSTPAGTGRGTGLGLDEVDASVEA